MRFAKPVPVPPWQGVLDATTPGPNAPQRLRDFPGLDVAPLIGAGWTPGDAYLTLGIITPDPAPTKEGPAGDAVDSWPRLRDPQQARAGEDGATVARDGICHVAINYRMGIEGFLPISGVPTNLGLRDMICALEWARDNIAAFGGDPDNVILLGESAGAMAIGVMQRLGTRLANDRAGFASLAPEACFGAVEAVAKPTARIDLRDKAGRKPVFGIRRFVPVHGDDVLPVQPLRAAQQGAGAEIDLLIGTNAEEMNLYLMPTGVRDKLGTLLSMFVLHRSQPQARKVLNAYGMEQKGRKPGQALLDAMSVLVFRWPARRFAEVHRGRTHMYEFALRSPAFDGELGACHIGGASG